MNNNFEMNQIEYEDAMIGMGIMEPPVPNKSRYLCQDENCEGKMITSLADYFPCCDICGIMNIDEPMHVDIPEYVPKAMLYKRRQYCMEKLNLIAGFKQSRSKHYKPMVKHLSKLEFNEITELKELMKEHKYHKFYKFIYNIYKDIKKHRLIPLTCQQIEFISREFVKLNCKFKEFATNKRKNMLCYTSVVWHIMKEHNIPNKEHLLLPLNHTSMIQMITEVTL
jgi:hypothetical protein